MVNGLRFTKKLKSPGRDAYYYYNAFFYDALIATIRHDTNGWWNSWHNTIITVSEAARQGVTDFVADLNRKEKADG